MADTNSTTEQSNIEKAESVANIVQAVINSVAGYYGGNTGKAFANALTGNGAIVTSIGDLVDKFNDGTTQTNELSGLKDAGVKSIDLNYVNTNITLGGIVNISFLPMNNIDFRTKKEVV